MIRSKLKYLIGAKAAGTVYMEPRSGSNLVKYPRFYVRSGQQTRQDKAGWVFGRVWNRTELNCWSKSGSLAGYPDPLLTLHMMNSILESMKGKSIIKFLDGILIHSHTLTEHIVHIWEVLNLRTLHCFEAKHVKCSWACQKVDFYICNTDKDGIYNQHYKTCSLMVWPLPENCKDVRGFLQLISYYSKFVKNNA